MKLLRFYIILLLLLPTIAAAQKQSDDVWIRFEEKQRGNNNYSYGYKDATGRIRIPARFGDFVSAQKFRHIMAVSDTGTMRNYYLLKDGRQVGRDSVYMFDFAFDCENERKIRFHSRANNRVGFLNSSGHAIIPAVYNYVSPFYNGLAFGCIGARLKCWSSEEDTMQCEHVGWEGGRMVLINERNQVLADSLPRSQLNNLNLYSLQINAPIVDTATTRTLRAVNGDRYTFTDYQKEFTYWFYQSFLPAVRSGVARRVEPLCYSELAVSEKPFRGWPHFERAAFIHRFYQSALRSKLSALKPGAKQIVISSESLNTLIFSGPRFQVFLTDCGEHFEEKYPAFSVIVMKIDASGKEQFDNQTHFDFIRTAEGYRLFSVSL